MKPKIFVTSAVAILLSATASAENVCTSRSTTCCEPQTLCATSACCQSEEMAGIVKAIDYYIEGGRKGDSKIARKGFAETATMSWYDNGELKSVPIQALYDLYDQPQKPEGDVFYEISSCSIADDVAIVRIESQFGPNKFSDMFTLVKDADGWKIVSKVYHKK